MKSVLLKLFGVAVSAAIIAYLVWDARHNKLFAQLVQQQKDWVLLAGAWAANMAAVVVSFVRWYYLVRALGLPFRLRDAFRLGFLGYLFNFVSLGSVGGDLFKAIFIAREQPKRRAEAVATVFVDRLIGLYALLVIASVSILVTGLVWAPQPKIRTLSYVTLLSTGIGGILVLMVLIPGFTSGAVSEALGAIPRVGPTIRRLIMAVRIYRSKPAVLLGAGALSVVVQSLATVGVYLVGLGLPGRVPSLGAHFVIIPLAMVSGLLPLPFMGLGAFEAVVEYLYRHLPGNAVIAEGQGLIVSLGYRVVTIAIAAVGACVWLASRREVAELIHEAKELESDTSTSANHALPTASRDSPSSEPSATA